MVAPVERPGQEDRDLLWWCIRETPAAVPLGEGPPGGLPAVPVRCTGAGPGLVRGMACRRQPPFVRWGGRSLRTPACTLLVRGWRGRRGPPLGQGMGGGRLALMDRGMGGGVLALLERGMGGRRLVLLVRFPGVALLSEDVDC